MEYLQQEIFSAMFYTSTYCGVHIIRRGLVVDLSNFEDRYEQLERGQRSGIDTIKHYT